MRDLDAELRAVRRKATIVGGLGWLLTCLGARELAGYAGLAIAFGVPLLVAGSALVVAAIRAEVEGGRK
jgi:NaMN:DMB phosphoribosyltransferase